jgi:hypothetical protein
VRRWLENYDTDQPWVIYRYGRTHDKFWPPWRSSRILGFAKIECECAVCGEKEIVKAPIPRWGDPNPGGGHHPRRIKFLLAHLHRDSKRHPMSWAKPLLNPAAHRGGIDLDLLAMRLEADLAAAPNPKEPR